MLAAREADEVPQIFPVLISTVGFDTGYYTYDFKPTATLPKGGVSHGSYITLTRTEGTTWQITYVHIAAESVKVNN